MFDVIIQRNNSEDIHVDKNLTTLQTFSGELRDSCSIVDPVILFEEPVTSFASANYMTISTFGRSYFIREIVSVAANLTEVRAHVDVLTSFKTEIRANSGIVLRQEKDWNLYLADDVIRIYQNPIVHTMAFPQGFSGSSYVLLVAGRRDSGIDVGQGGVISGNGADGGGAGNTNSKTTSGLLSYALTFVGVGKYWFGTFGQTADADLLAAKRPQYPNQYNTAVVGGEPFEDQYGSRVFDCVGLIKAYRWSSSPSAQPVYVAAEDVNVQGLYAQCTRFRGLVDTDHLDQIPLGAVLFYNDLQHCGVYAGGVGGHVIEARGHAFGVQYNSLADRPNFTMWGVPDWLVGTTASSDTYLPVIIQQPVDVTAPLGSNVNFTVAATSTGGTLSYQWQYFTGGRWYNSPATGNQTPTLSLEATAARNGLQYRCIVSNPIGSTTSDAATLTVT